MKPGDLARDTYENIGVVVDTTHRGLVMLAPPAATPTHFVPNSGYGNVAWVLEENLEVISVPDSTTDDIANDPVDW